MNFHDLDAFTQGYIECAFWLSLDQADPETGGDPIEDNYDYCDLDSESLDSMVVDCVAFQKQNALLLELFEGLLGCETDYAGHDFWLTRNGHGAGFWGRGAGFVGDVLTKRAHACGECDLYVGDDEKLHVC